MFLHQTWLFGVLELNGVNQILLRLTLVAMATKFKDKTDKINKIVGGVW